MIQERVTIKELAQKQGITDFEKMNRILLALIHTQGLFVNLMKDLTDMLKCVSLYRFNVKKNLIAIANELRNSPKYDGASFSIENQIAIGDDAETYERISRQFFGIDGGSAYLMSPSRELGAIYWDADTGRAYKLVDYHCNLTIHPRRTYDKVEWYDGLAVDMNSKVKNSKQITELMEDNLFRHKEEMEKWRQEHLKN